MWTRMAFAREGASLQDVVCFVVGLWTEGGLGKPCHVVSTWRKDNFSESPPDPSTLIFRTVYLECMSLMGRMYTTKAIQYTLVEYCITTSDFSAWRRTEFTYYACASVARFKRKLQVRVDVCLHLLLRWSQSGRKHVDQVVRIRPPPNCRNQPPRLLSRNSLWLWRTFFFRRCSMNIILIGS